MHLEIVPLTADQFYLRLTASNGNQFRLHEGTCEECEAARADLARACEKAIKP